jgi:hypothetical protein
VYEGEIVDSCMKTAISPNVWTHAGLQGLLNKKPADRLGWPDLLDHPFVKETSVGGAHMTETCQLSSCLSEMELDHPDNKSCTVHGCLLQTEIDLLGLPRCYLVSLF